MSNDKFQRPVNLRPHHLLCLLTWKGVGYSKKFTAKFDSMTQQFTDHGRLGIKVVEGLDDLCDTLHPEKTSNYHCDRGGIKNRDNLVLEDINEHLALLLAHGTVFTLTPKLQQDFRTSFQEGTVRRGCASCDFQNFCTGIADEGFAETRLIDAFPYTKKS